MGPVTDEMNAIPLPLEEELALVDAAEPEAAATAPRAEPAEPSPKLADEDDSESVDIVAVVDDLLEPASPNRSDVAMRTGRALAGDLLPYRPRS